MIRLLRYRLATIAEIDHFTRAQTRRVRRGADENSSGLAGLDSKPKRAVDLGPAVRAPGLFRPGFDEPKLLLELRVVHDLAAHRSALVRHDLNDSLHSVVRFDASSHFAMVGTDRRAVRCGAPGGRAY